MNEIEDKAYALLEIHKKISIPLIMRKFKVNADEAKRVCHKVWLRQHVEARKLAKEINGS